MRVRIDPPRRPEAPERSAPGPTAVREVAPRRTVQAPAEIRSALARAYEKIHGRAIDRQQLDVLAAQVCHETGWGASMHNFNFGGIKGASADGATARCRTKEVLGGEERSIVDGFRAYRSADEGAVDYVRFVERRYPEAWAASARGDVDGFVRGLKSKGYFTADEAGYAAAVRGVLARGFDDDAPIAPASPISAQGFVPSTLSLPEGPSTIALARVMDAVAASSSRIAGPSTDEG